MEYASSIAIKLYDEKTAARHVLVKIACEVQEAGCKVLGERDFPDENMLAIVEVVEAMAAHVGDTSVQEQGCIVQKFFVSRCYSFGCVVHIVAAGGIRVLLTAITAHVGNARVQEKGCVVLGVSMSISKSP